MNACAILKFLANRGYGSFISLAVPVFRRKFSGKRIFVRFYFDNNQKLKEFIIGQSGLPGVLAS
jgi:hypothetical protein